MLFGLFKRKKKEIIVNEVQFNNLKKWLAESEQVNSILDEFNNETISCFSQLNEISDKTESSLETLKAVNLENRKVEKRIKDIVLNNKIAYIERVKHFLSDLKGEVESINSKGYNLEGIETFVNNANKQLDVFSKQSFKAFHLTSELIGKELEAVTNYITEINNSIKKIKAIHKEKVEAIELIKENLESIDKKERTIEDLKSEIIDKQKEKQSIDEKLANIEKKNKEIKISPKWEERQDLASNIDLLNNKLKANSSAVLNLFTPIEKALKKWAWKEKNNEILDYIEKPDTILKQESILEIIKILDKIKQDTIQNNLGFDEKRKKKILKNIEEITEEKLISFIKEEKKIKESIEKSKEELSKYNFELLDSTKLIIQKEDIDQEIEKLEKRGKGPEQEIEDKKGKIEDLIKLIPNVKLIK